MSANEIIEQVRKLPPAEVFELSQWLRAYEVSLWDQQIETDIRAGKLDKLSQEALDELGAGQTCSLPP